MRNIREVSISHTGLVVNGLYSNMASTFSHPANNKVPPNAEKIAVLTDGVTQQGQDDWKQLRCCLLHLNDQI
jgi:hypothetical protein